MRRATCARLGGAPRPDRMLREGTVTGRCCAPRNGGALLVHGGGTPASPAFCTSTTTTFSAKSADRSPPSACPARPADPQALRGLDRRHDHRADGSPRRARRDLPPCGACSTMPARAQHDSRQVPVPAATWVAPSGGVAGRRPTARSPIGGRPETDIGDVSVPLSLGSAGAPDIDAGVWNFAGRGAFPPSEVPPRTTASAARSRPGDCCGQGLKTPPRVADWRCDLPRSGTNK